MTWFKASDDLAFHLKVVLAGNEAMGAWVRMGSWSSGAGTNGLVPDEMALTIAGRQEVLDRLVAARRSPAGHGLLERVDGGYVLHDFLKHNPRAEEARARREELREKKSRAGRAGAAKRWGDKEHGADDDSRDGSPMAGATSLPGGTEAEPGGARRPVENGRSQSEAGGWQVPSSGARLPRQADGPDPGSRSTTRGSDQGRAREDLDPSGLPPAAALAHAAIVADDSLRPICARPATLAADLVRVGPAVDVALEVARAGAWLRANPAKAKKNGAAFLTNWITRTQERGGTPGYQPPAPDAPARPPAPPPPPPHRAVLEEARRVDAKSGDLFGRIGSGGEPDEEDEP